MSGSHLIGSRAMHGTGEVSEGVVDLWLPTGIMLLEVVLTEGNKRDTRLAVAVLDLQNRSVVHGVQTGRKGKASFFETIQHMAK